MKVLLPCAGAYDAVAMLDIIMNYVSVSAPKMEAPDTPNLRGK